MAPSATTTVTATEQAPVKEFKILTHVGPYKEIATDPNYDRAAEENGADDFAAAKVSIEI